MEAPTWSDRVSGPSPEELDNCQPGDIITFEVTRTNYNNGEVVGTPTVTTHRLKVIDLKPASEFLDAWTIAYEDPDQPQVRGRVHYDLVMNELAYDLVPPEDCPVCRSLDLKVS